MRSTNQSIQSFNGKKERNQKHQSAPLFEILPKPIIFQDISLKLREISVYKWCYFRNPTITKWNFHKHY